MASSSSPTYTQSPTSPSISGISQTFANHQYSAIHSHTQQGSSYQQNHGGKPSDHTSVGVQANVTAKPPKVSKPILSQGADGKLHVSVSAAAGSAARLGGKMLLKALESKKKK